MEQKNLGSIPALSQCLFSNRGSEKLRTSLSKNVCCWCIPIEKNNLSCDAGSNCRALSGTNIRLQQGCGLQVSYLAND